MIYIDPLFTWHADGYHGPDAAQARRTGERNGHQWCHLFADEADCAELYTFAARLGMRQEWFQRDHYDLTPAKRTKAVKLGAREVTRREAVAIWSRAGTNPPQLSLFNSVADNTSIVRKRARK
jgi:hypothetical protein